MNIEIEKHGTLMKYKGELYCYDETTTSKKDVLDAIKHDWIDRVTEIVNNALTDLAKDNQTLASVGCQGMVMNGSIPRESYLDKLIELEGTLTLELK